jgi:ATP-dependent helicase HrpA
MEFAYNTTLPIYQNRQEIIKAVQGQQVIIVAGETGCGKTTHVPLMCLEALGTNAGKIVCTQPRRIAAISLARFVSSLVPDAPETIGYKVRFRDTIKPDTRISFVTDGIVLAETTSDPLLKRYDCIIIDEAHERSINIDFLLGYLRWLLPKRPELKLIISSATLDIRLFSTRFNNAPVIMISGRLFPVEIRYEPVIALWQGSAMRSYVDGVVHAVESIVTAEEPGDILAFLPTVDDIQECLNILVAKYKKREVNVLPLFGRMTPEEQEKIFVPARGRRIVLATNIAETSITVPAIRYVVDTGLSRSVVFDGRAGINRMPVSAISQASANQRAGRCGRVRNGVCIRLYSQQDFASRPKFTTPEIRRVNCAGVLLRMANLGINRPRNFPFLQPPSPAAVESGFRQLRFLGAFDGKGKLTKLGRAMARLPLDPAVARMLLYAHEHGAFSEVAIIAAALSIDTLWTQQPRSNTADGRELSPRGFKSDFMTFVSVWQSLPRRRDGMISRKLLNDFCRDAGLSLQHVKEWINIHRQLIKICVRLGPAKPTGTGTYEQIHKALLSAFALNCAKREPNGLYRTGQTHDIMIWPGSKLRKDSFPWVLFHDIVETKRPFGRNAAVIKSHWIEELFKSSCLTRYENPHYDPETGTVQCFRNVIFNGLFIVENQLVDYGKVVPKEAQDIFIEEALVNEHTLGIYDFLHNNRRVRNSIDLAQQKLRDNSLYRGDKALSEFYQERLPGIVCDRQLRGNIKLKGDRFLFVPEKRLLTGPYPKELAEYPDTTMIAGSKLSITYCHAEGDERDGAMFTVPLELFRIVPFTYWEWLLPIFWPPRLKHILAQLEIKDISEVDCNRIIGLIEPGKGGFIYQMVEAIEKVFAPKRLGNSPKAVRIPDYLWPRVYVVDNSGNVLDSFRPPVNPTSLPVSDTGLRPDIFSPWCTEWEKDSIDEFDFPVFRDVRLKPPHQIVPFWGLMALSAKNNNVSLRVFLSSSAAIASHRLGAKALIGRALVEKMAWAWRDFSSGFRLPPEMVEIIDIKGFLDLVEPVFNEIVFDLGYEAPCDSRTFDLAAQACSGRIAEGLPKAFSLVCNSLLEFKKCEQLLDSFCTSNGKPALSASRQEGLEKDLERYMKLLYKPCQPMNKIIGIPRYLRAFGFRVHYACNKPLRYDSNSVIIYDLKASLASMRRLPEAVFPHAAKMLDEFDLMIEEYCIMLFANGQVPLAFPVSEQRVERARQQALQALENDRLRFCLKCE